MEQLVLLAEDEKCSDRIQCPKILKYGRGSVVQGKKLTPELRAQLGIPDGIPDDEDAVFLPDSNLITTAARHPLMETP